MFISMQILIFHPMRKVNIFAYFQRFRGLLIRSPIFSISYLETKPLYSLK